MGFGSHGSCLDEEIPGRNWPYGKAADALKFLLSLQGGIAEEAIHLYLVIPAKAGISLKEIPAFAGMTKW